jgi:hypothetical protein
MNNYSGAQLASALHSLDVDFVLSDKETTSSLKRNPLRLIIALAESEEARLRLSLIPLFLRHPEYSKYVRSAAKAASPAARLTLQCFYTAAVWLQRKYEQRLANVIGKKTTLPNLFGKDLMLSTQKNPDENLEFLARRHQELSKKHINWLGTYEHGAQRFMVHLEKQKHGRTRRRTNPGFP